MARVDDNTGRTGMSLEFFFIVCRPPCSERASERSTVLSGWFYLIAKRNDGMAADKVNGISMVTYWSRNAGEVG